MTVAPQQGVVRFLDTRGEHSQGPSLTEIKEFKTVQSFAEFSSICLNHFKFIETKNNFFSCKY